MLHVSTPAAAAILNNYPQPSTQAFSCRSLDSTWHSVTSRSFAPSRVSEKRTLGILGWITPTYFTTLSWLTQSISRLPLILKMSPMMSNINVPSLVFLSQSAVLTLGSVSSRECLDAPAILATFTAGRTGLVACLWRHYNFNNCADNPHVICLNFICFFFYRLEKKRNAKSMPETSS